MNAEYPTLADAKALVERMKLARPMCPFCARENMDWFERRTDETRARMRDVGWADDPATAAVVLRCYTCRDSLTFPWADRLDLEKVLAVMRAKDQERPRCAWFLGELEKTL